MKLSDIRGREVFGVIAKITGPVLNIAVDDDAAALFKREKCPEGMEPRDFMVARLRKAVPLLMEKHQDDLAAILAAFDRKPVEEFVEGLTMASLLAGIGELLTDEDFLAFFA